MPRELIGHILGYLFIVILAGAVFYGAIAFINLQGNPLDWTTANRAMWLAAVSATMVFRRWEMTRGS